MIIASPESLKSLWMIQVKNRGRWTSWSSTSASRAKTGQMAAVTGGICFWKLILARWVTTCNRICFPWSRRMSIWLGQVLEDLGCQGKEFALYSEDCLIMVDHGISWSKEWPDKGESRTWTSDMYAEVLTKQVQDRQWGSVSGHFSASTMICSEKARLPSDLRHPRLNRFGFVDNYWFSILSFSAFCLLTSQVIHV